MEIACLILRVRMHLSRSLINWGVGIGFDPDVWIEEKLTLGG